MPWLIKKKEEKKRKEMAFFYIFLNVARSGYSIEVKKRRGLWKLLTGNLTKMKSGGFRRGSSHPLLLLVSCRPYRKRQTWPGAWILLYFSSQRRKHFPHPHSPQAMSQPMKNHLLGTSRSLQWTLVDNIRSTLPRFPLKSLPHSPTPLIPPTCLWFCCHLFVLGCNSLFYSWINPYFAGKIPGSF